MLGSPRAQIYSLLAAAEEEIRRMCVCSVLQNIEMLTVRLRHCHEGDYFQSAFIRIRSKTVGEETFV